ncbi:MAG: ATPase domain-containing protein [Candidatus Micrarchaeota archaeon]
MARKMKMPGGPASGSLSDGSATGIDELDRMLGGGFPKGSTVLLCGTSGSGKTIMSFQWLFDGVRKGENGIYVSMTEPLFKIVRNLEAMGFYDRESLESEKLAIIDLRDHFDEKEIDEARIVSFIEKKVKAADAKRLCIDSITAIAYCIGEKSRVRHFMFELGKVLSALGCTTVLTNEMRDKDVLSAFGVEEFISDSIIKLDQRDISGELQRVMQVIKMRGRKYRAEERYFKIAGEGLAIFPSISADLSYPSGGERISLGNPELDSMLGGGVPSGSSTLIMGSSGTGKTLSALQFLVEGLKKGEPSLYVGFDESRDEIIRNARGFGWDLARHEKDGLLTLRCTHPSEKFMEEHLKEIESLIKSKGIRRCVIDPIEAFAGYIPDEMVYRFPKKLTILMKKHGGTTVMVAEMPIQAGSVFAARSHVSEQVDNIISLRHVEMEGRLRQVLNILKVRGSNHSKELRLYDITGSGMLIGEPLSGFEGVLTGIGRKVSKSAGEKLEEEFRRFIGPMGPAELAELSRKGLSEKSLNDYIYSLVKEGLMKKENAKEFQAGVLAILRGREGHG